MILTDILKRQKVERGMTSELMAGNCRQIVRYFVSFAENEYIEYMYNALINEILQIIDIYINNIWLYNSDQLSEVLQVS